MTGHHHGTHTAAHTISAVPERVVKRFWGCVAARPTEPVACWMWGGRIDKGGYGRLNWSDRGQAYTMTAHRFAYLLANGVISPDVQVRHDCPHITCVRPAHLYAGGGRITSYAGRRNPQRLRRQLLLESPVCWGCGFAPLHFCQLQVHHRDGDRRHNERPNLALLCANCHSLVSAYQDARRRGEEWPATLVANVSPWCTQESA